MSGDGDGDGRTRNERFARRCAATRCGRSSDRAAARTFRCVTRAKRVSVGACACASMPVSVRVHMHTRTRARVSTPYALAS